MVVSDIRLVDLTATIDLGHKLGARLKAGDAVLLTGDLGAGKTALARAMIQACAGAGIDVPSPTFNLVIPYVLRDLTITHFDLYRLDGPDDVQELGLDEALDDGAIIVEWPDRLGDLALPTALNLNLAHAGDGRLVTFSGPQAIVERFLEP